MYGYGYSLYNRIPFLGSGGGIDPAAQAYFAATGITGVTQQTAINDLVKGLKTDGIWSKMKAVYPFVTDNRNRLSYTEDFTNNFWTKNAISITANTTTAPDGTTTADTLSDGLTNNAHYINTPVSLGINGNNTLSIYAKANTLNFLWIYFYNGVEPAGPAAWFNLSNGTIGTVYSGITANIENAGNGWYRCSITRNFNFTASFSNCGYGVSNADNVVSYLGTNKSIFVWGPQLDAGLTPTTYQPIATTQQAFIASQFKYNLVNPVDSDAAFRLVFNGGWTHSSNGATPNGVNAYADTNLNENSVMTLNNMHISVYLRTNKDALMCDIGLSSGTVESNIFPRLTNLFYARMTDSGLGPTIANTDSRGFFVSNRTNSTQIKAIKNNTISTIANNSISKTNLTYYIGAYRGATTPNFFSDRQAAFSTIGDGLTDTDASKLYTRVQAYQTALSRNV
jgi:hypothetical protein